MNEISIFWVLLIVASVILWLITLLSLLERQDMKDVDKIVWTIVLCTLSVFGMLLYWMMAPAKPSNGTAHVRSEKELKDYFNSRDQKS